MLCGLLFYGNTTCLNFLIVHLTENYIATNIAKGLPPKRPNIIFSCISLLVGFDSTVQV